ncbi:MAG TPA: hypothetical protein P5044_01050, partial [bacterium]|nr:hypothetical protein [bacterium]
MSKRPETAKFAIVALLLLVLSAGCSVKKSCSADSQCDEGSFCSSDGECVEFKEDDYALVFEGLSDGQTVTSADDADKSKDGTQIDIAVTVNDSAGVVKDGTSMSLSVTAEGKTSVIYFGTTVKDRVIFSLVTIPFGEVTLKANLVNNPSLAAQIKISSKNIDIELYYLKNGENGSKTVLQNATVKDDDDLDKITSNGLQISVSASTTGLKQGDYIKIFMPEIQEELISEAVIDEKGEAQFGTVNVPIISKVRLTVVSGDYSENMEFSVDSQQHCGFLTNLENDMILGSINDKNENVSDLQYDLVVSDIAGCGDGSTISVYIDKDPGEGVTPDSTFETASNMAQERITFEKSKTANDKRKVVVVIEDAAKSIKGSSEFSGILVDLDAPLAETSFPEAGQTLNMSDDIDSATPGLQVKFAGTASDDLTPPVTVYVKLDDTIISEQSVSDGDFEVEYSFNQSYTTMMLYVVAIDGAGNSVESNTPFSVNIDTQLKFIHVCGREGSVLIDGAWLNHSADLDTMENLQCKAVLQVSEESGADQISLKVGDGATVTKTVNGDNEAEFDLSLADTDSGILLNATAYINGTSAGQNSMTFRVDTIPPVVTLSNDLLLNNGETTSSVDITFGFECSESYCEYNSWLDSELTNTYDISTSRDVTGLASGGHVFKVRARDAAGNTGDQTVFNWTVDSVAPETTITADPGEGTTDDFAFFTFESSKNGSSFQCRLEKDGVYFIPADGSWEDCNSAKRDYFGLDNGSYRFFVRAEDSLGNIDPSPAEHEWLVGSTAPVTTIDTVVPADIITNVNGITFTYSASVDSTFECRLEKGGTVIEDWADCSSGTAAYSSLADGIYLFSVKATAVYGTEELNPAS